MIYADFKDFIGILPARGRIMGIDFGVRRIGTAVSDPLREYAFPRDIILCAQLPLQKLLDVIAAEQIVGIVIGLPQYADGTDSDTTRRVRAFANELAARMDLPIIFIDERLTSVAAEEITGKKVGIDAAAAAVILSDAIAMIKTNKG